MSRLLYSPWFDILITCKVVKPLKMQQLSPACYSLSLSWSEYFPRQPVLKYIQFMFVSSSQKPGKKPTQNHSTVYLVPNVFLLQAGKTCSVLSSSKRSPKLIYSQFLPQYHFDLISSFQSSSILRIFEKNIYLFLFIYCFLRSTQDT
jgi:hypothetical protein